MSEVPIDSPPALELTGLLKRFGAKIAVDNLHLRVRTGCMFGLVGPNGAGKTTTLSMVTGLLRPDAGQVYVTGVDVWADPATAQPERTAKPTLTNKAIQRRNPTRLHPAAQPTPTP